MLISGDLNAHVPAPCAPWLSLGATAGNECHERHALVNEYVATHGLPSVNNDSTPRIATKGFGGEVKRFIGHMVAL